MLKNRKSLMIIGVSFILACLYLFLDNVIFHVFLDDNEEYFFNHFTHLSQYEMWMRIITILFCIILAIVIAYFFNQKEKEHNRFVVVRNKLQNQLNASESDAERMREMEVKLRNILDAICDYVCVVEKDGKISYANPAVYREMNLINDREASLKIDDILSEDDCRIAFERMNVAIENGEELPMKVYDFHVPGSDRCVIPAEVNTSSFFDDGIQKILVVARPITERLQLEDERRRSERLHSIGVLAGGIAHDFNNLLVGILANGSLLLEINSEDSHAKMLVGEIVSAAKRSTGLTQQLLTFAKGGSFNREIVSVSHAITDSAKFSVKGSSSKCSVHMPKDLWMANVDAGQICQVIQNLVINSSQSMPEGGKIHVKAENTIVEQKNSLNITGGDYIHIWVKDSGSGIPKKYIEKVFDPYFSTKNVIGNGSGLGLAVVHSVIKKHDGHIFVNSKCGKGTTFHIYLPAVRIATLEKTASVLEKKSKKEHLKILLMDDEQMVRSVVVQMCKHLDHCVEAVENGDDALRLYSDALASNCQFDLVILDLTIPNGMGGIEALKNLKEIDPNVVAIASSGYSENRPDGFKYFLPKPFDLKAMKAIFAEAV